MSLRRLTKNHQNFENNIKILIRYGLDIICDLNLQDSHRSNNFKTIILESLLLRTCAHWEKFLDTELLLLINLNTENFKKHMELPDNTKLNIKLIRAILYSDKYKDFHDIIYNKNYFSKILVNKYNPFGSLQNEQIRKINFTYTLRNYLSHYSEYAKKKLHNAYIENYNYKIFQEPGNFLLKENGKYFENLIHNFILISVTMRKYLGVKNGKAS